MREGRPRFAYFPFGGRQHTCIGEQFALLEGISILAVLLPRFQFQLEPAQRIVPRPAITLRPKHGIRVRIPITVTVGAASRSSCRQFCNGMGPFCIKIIGSSPTNGPGKAGLQEFRRNSGGLTRAAWLQSAGGLSRHEKLDGTI
jgi:hypothetical protein